MMLPTSPVLAHAATHMQVADAAALPQADRPQSNKSKSKGKPAKENKEPVAAAAPPVEQKAAGSKKRKADAGEVADSAKKQRSKTASAPAATKRTRQPAKPTPGADEAPVADAPANEKKTKADTGAGRKRKRALDDATASGKSEDPVAKQSKLKRKDAKKHKAAAMPVADVSKPKPATGGAKAAKKTAATPKAKAGAKTASPAADPAASVSAGVLTTVA